VVSADGEAMASMLEWRPVLSLGLVLAVFFYFATRFALQQSLWTDETTQLSGLTLGFAENLRWLTGALVNPFPVPPDRMPPVGYWIGRVWKLLVGGDVLSMRYLSVAASAGAVIAVWFAGRRFFGPRAAFAASLLLAASPNLVVQSVEIRAYSLFLFFASLMVYYYLRAASARLSQSRWDLWSFSAVAILCSFTHFYGVVIAVGGFVSLFILAMLKAEDGEERVAILKGFLAPGLVSALFVIPLLPFVLAAVKVSGPAVAADTLPARDYVHDLAKMVYRFYAHQTLRGVTGLNLLVPALGLALTLLACLVDLSQRARQLAVFLAVNVALVATAGLLTRSFDVFTPSYNVWALPVVSLILASTLAHSGRLWRNMALTGLVVLLAGNLYGSVQLSNQGRFYAHSRSEDLRRAVESLGVEKTAVVFVNDSPHSYFPLIYLFGPTLDLYQIREGGLQAITPGRLGQTAELQGLGKKYLILVGSEQLSADDLQRDLAEGKEPAGAVKVLADFEMAQAGGLSANWRLVDRYNLLSQSALSVAVYQGGELP
jgi:4-amino-4-deoxy-L-arabinose transferase-like glycosyltransferase